MVVRLGCRALHPASACWSLQDAGAGAGAGAQAAGWQAESHGSGLPGWAGWGWGRPRRDGAGSGESGPLRAGVQASYQPNPGSQTVKRSLVHSLTPLADSQAFSIQDLSPGPPPSPSLRPTADRPTYPSVLLPLSSLPATITLLIHALLHARRSPARLACAVPLPAAGTLNALPSLRITDTQE